MYKRNARHNSNQLSTIYQGVHITHFKRTWVTAGSFRSEGEGVVGPGKRRGTLEYFQLPVDKNKRRGPNCIHTASASKNLYNGAENRKSKLLPWCILLTSKM